MALKKEDKEALCARMKSDLEGASLVLFAGFKGLTTGEVLEAKKKMKAGRTTVSVVKNSLLKKVLGGLSFEVEDKDFWKGETMMLAAANSDFIHAAKSLADWSRQTQKIKIKGGVLTESKKWLTHVEVRTLASLPGLVPLRGQLVNLLASPLAALQGVLEAVHLDFLLILKAVGESQNRKEGGTNASHG